MANTYTQLFVQCVFAVKYRLAILHSDWEERLRAYISGIVRNQGHKMLAINNVSDHLHLLIGLNPDQSISNLMKVVKGESSEWINSNKFTRQKFNWQLGYGAFSYSKSQVKPVINYIANQKEHHKKINFLDEYKKLLIEFDVEFNDKYLFKPLI